VKAWQRSSLSPGRRALDRLNAAKAARLDQWIKLIKVLAPVVLALIALATGIFVVKK
jgi:hypothetical protein